MNRPRFNGDSKVSFQTALIGVLLSALVTGAGVVLATGGGLPREEVEKAINEKLAPMEYRLQRMETKIDDQYRATAATNSKLDRLIGQWEGKQ